jgi:hypothetical protein
MFPCPIPSLFLRVLAGGNHTLELGIFEGMVIRTYGQALLGRVHRRPVGDRPRYQNAIDRQPEIIVQPTGAMLLNDKDASAAAPPHPSHRLRGFGNSPPVVLFEWRSRVACFMTPCSGSSIFTGRTVSTAVKLAEAILE